MEKTKTTLGTQKKVIIILACLAAVLLAAYFLIGIFFKEEQLPGSREKQRLCAGKIRSWKN